MNISTTGGHAAEVRKNQVQSQITVQPRRATTSCRTVTSGNSILPLRLFSAFAIMVGGTVLGSLNDSLPLVSPTTASAQEGQQEKPGMTIAIRRQSEAAEPAEPSEPLFTSQKLSQARKSQQFDVKLGESRDLYFVAGDAGDGFSCDWGDWLNVKLIGPDKEMSLTQLDWKSASTGYGQISKGKNIVGGALSVGGTTYEDGIGTHANSTIHFQIPAGFDRLTGTVALDDGGLKQGCGSTMAFEIYDQKPVLAAAAMHSPDKAVAGLDVTDGLEATLFAAEPDIYSITNIDIDHRGRIWACEVMNYRGNDGKRPAGDRILILEDTDHDGVADTKKVFYQGRDVDSAMGICVVGKHVVVSATPNIWVFTDEDGDDVPDKKTALFTKTGQPQHDHSAHSFVYGPDGKFYWNFGNTGKAVFDSNGSPVKDQWGQDVVDNGKPYFGGMVFRCDPDGSNFEVLAHNFRNNYEVAVDSYGSLWQSDNDDDGNRGVRINYVVENGNYGYLDQKTGDGWRVPRTGMSGDVPMQHWHLNDPGVMPNLMLTGAGSPCSITVYEGRLLPERFWDQVIHCDAGPNVVRSYIAKPEGAGYVATIEDIAVGSRDRWFRPVDPCVAPDGSLFVSDWYDPGVGGHGMADLDRGRIFRFAPPNNKYEVPEFDFSTAEGAVAALRSPALSVRAMAHQSLTAMGEKAEPALKDLLADKNPRLAARALWILGKGVNGKKYLRSAFQNDNADLRIVALRIARQMGWAEAEMLKDLAKDPSPQVRREVAVALFGQESEAAADAWLTLAKQYEAGDRWMLESLGLAADKNWDKCLTKWLDHVGDDWNSEASRDIIWRSRADESANWLVKIISQEDVSEADSQRYYRALDFQPEEARDQALEMLLLGE